MDSQNHNKRRVIDLLTYRTERLQPRLDFGNPKPAGPTRLAVVRPFRVLTDREVAHRERMATFLAGQRSEVRTQR